MTDFRTRWFVGRQAELEDLTARWKQAVDGNRQTVVLVGEPGIGKSTLVATLAERVVGDGGRGAVRTHGRGATGAVSTGRGEAVRGAVKGDACFPFADRITVWRTDPSLAGTAGATT